jgi:hypothetical protein
MTQDKNKGRMGLAKKLKYELCCTAQAKGTSQNALMPQN